MKFQKIALGILNGCLIFSLLSCEKASEEDLPNFLERGIYRSAATGDEILIGDIDAVIAFKGKKMVVVAFEAKSGGTLEFSPISGREDSFLTSSASKSSWAWEPRTIRQHAGETTLQNFSLITP